jgi:hypothetical protein
MIVFFTGCTDSKEVSIDNFIEAATTHGFKFEPLEDNGDDGNLKKFLVVPGQMYISIEKMDNVKSAKAKVKIDNQDINAIKKHVIRDGTALSEMGDLPEAFRKGSLILYIPVNYIVHFKEAKVLAKIFNEL